MEMQLDLRELFRILWRRKWFFVLPLVLALCGAIAAILLMPPLYRSQATLLIERQDIPENFVPSLVTEQIDRRLEVITRQVLSGDNLYRIAERHGLYADARDTLSRGDIVGSMRDNIETESLVTEFRDLQSGRTGEATLAFQVSFAYADPELARRVTDDLVSIYLASTSESRREVATLTTEFLAGAREAVESRLSTIEDELTRFQTENRELLPEEADFKRRQVANHEQRLRSLDSNLRSLRERESFLATQLALIDEFEAPRGADTPEGRVELLRTELAAARARYNASHPDVVRLQRELSALEALVGTRGGTSTLAQREVGLQAELASLLERYTDAHPDVQRVERELAATQQTLAASAGPEVGNAAMSRNSTFIGLSAQLNGIRSEIRAIEEEQAQIEEERLALQQDLARAPEIERQYNGILRRLDNALLEREELVNRESDAQLSGSLEASAAGERLTLMEPASTPGSPSSPNKKLILAIGIVLGVGSGGGMMILRELLDRSIHSARDLAKIVGDTPLAVIPVIRAPADRWRRWSLRLGIPLVLLLAAGGIAVWVHNQVVPLDVLGYQTANEAERWIARRLPGVAADG